MRAFATGMMALAMAWSTTIARAEEAGPVYDVVTLMPLEATVRVEADGRLAHFELTSTAPPEIRAGMGRLVGSWRFEPPTDAQGKPAAVDAKARLVLLAQPDGERFEVHVDRVTFSRKHDGGSFYDLPTARLSDFKLTPPRFPIGPLKQGLSGVVLVALRFAPDGQVADTAVVQTALFEPADTATRTSQALHAFEQATLAAARHWTAHVEARGVPTADDLTVVVPVHFGFRPDFELQLGQWRRVARTGAAAIPWRSSERVAPGVADVGGSVPAPLEAPLRLIGDPAGAKF
jgi:hypothetical protein